MIVLLGGGMAHGSRDGGIAGGQGLSLVEGLRGHLAGMVDPHQANRLGALWLGEGGSRRRGRGCAGCTCRSG